MTSFQSSELTELPVVEDSQLFAQRGHSAWYAPIVQAPSQGAHKSSKAACGASQDSVSGQNRAFRPHTPSGLDADYM